MHKGSHQPVFHYNAHGHALSGHIVRPLDHLIEVQAPTSLPTTGGHGTSQVDNFEFQKFVSFKSGRSYASGSPDKEENSYSTLVTAAVEGLNILDVVTADRVVARISCHHVVPDDEAHITVLGSHFENLRIAGCPVDVELDHELFLKLDTLQGVRKELETNAEFRRMAEDPFQTGQTRKSPNSHGSVHCSLVKNMTTKCPGVKRRGHVFEVPQFGNVYVAEVIVEHSRRTMTMLRVELGCPVGGSIITAQVQGNGWPL
jgi:hypothetical protein